MWMVVGLGNPGPKYLMNRHNIGFMALDNFTAGIGKLPAREERKAITYKFKLAPEKPKAGHLGSEQPKAGQLTTEKPKAGHFKSETPKAEQPDNEEVLFVKPQTFMNKSGEAVRDLMQFYKIEVTNLIVVHDEIEIPFGTIKIVKNRGAGGHNGLKSINELLGTQDYTRIRLGVSRPPHVQMDVADWVLQNFSPEEVGQITPILNAAGDAVESLIFDGYEKAATKHNKNYLPAVTAEG